MNSCKANVRPFLRKDEQLYRVIKDIFINKTGNVSSAAYKDGHGLSVFRSDEYSVEEMHKHICDSAKLSGNLGFVTVGDTHECKAKLLHLPSCNSEKHCEIHGDETHVQLSQSQAKHLAEKSILTGHIL